MGGKDFRGRWALRLSSFLQKLIIPVKSPRKKKFCVAEPRLRTPGKENPPYAGSPAPSRGTTAEALSDVSGRGIGSHRRLEKT